MMYVAVIAAAVAAMVVGALWYSPVLFGNMWMKEVGMKKSEMEAKEGVWKLYLSHLVLNIVQAALFSYAIGMLGIDSYSQLLSYGVFAWLALMAVPMLGGLIWEERSCRLYLINVFHSLASLVVMLYVLMAVVNMG